MNTKDLMEMGVDLAREEAEAARLQGDARRYRDAMNTAIGLLRFYENQPVQQSLAWAKDARLILENALNPKPKTEVPCPTCQGRGDVLDNDPMRERTQWVGCRTCGGTGRMTLADFEKYKTMNAYPKGRWQ